MKNWIAVASEEHVCIGHAQGFMQVCHGKAAPLRRISPGDSVVYYSPTAIFGANKKAADKLQKFTAIGIAKERTPYQVEMYPGFLPFRRDVAWHSSQPASILPLLDQLEFSRDSRNWGYQFRFGLFEISEHDMQLIATAMKATLMAPQTALFSD
jgi:hypothetical protein